MVRPHVGNELFSVGEICCFALHGIQHFNAGLELYIFVQAVQDGALGLVFVREVDFMFADLDEPVCVDGADLDIHGFSC